jgi:ubiquinone/menaquinone biosynthesis C-methylase UbiE
LTAQRVKPYFFAHRAASLAYKTATLMKTLLRFFFRLLYHQFAFTYDLVAATVSLGRWKDWVFSVLPFVQGQRVLEIGHGPGHLQRALLERGLLAFGIDESTQMGHLARHNLKRHIAKSPHSDYTQIKLTRGISQYLPFASEAFDTIVSTFPSEYIFDPKTLVEAQRVLAQNGRFIILPGASILGRGILDRAMALLFRITGETPPHLAEMLQARTKQPFATAGFQVEFHEVDVRSSMVLILVATKVSR